MKKISFTFKTRKKCIMKTKSKTFFPLFRSTLTNRKKKCVNTLVEKKVKIQKSFQILDFKKSSVHFNLKEKIIII
jgi:hypothetical protein